MILVGQWYVIAKADILVRTAKIRKARKLASLLIVAFSLAWILHLAPQLMSFVLSSFSYQFELLISQAFFGFMRSILLIIWLIMLIIPLSNSLEEIKTGHWEILLSNNVRTRDIMIGTFIGKLPIYGMIVVILAPIIISPITIYFNVSFVGQLLMYGVLVAMAFITLWISNVIVTGIQAVLGESPRGNDIAKALSWAIIPLIAFPAFGIMYLMGSVAHIMGFPFSLLLPSTWSADLITWSAIYFNGNNLYPSNIMNLTDFLYLNPIFYLVFFSLFSIIMVVVGQSAADRIFVIDAGKRTETITTIVKENVVIRGIRRVAPGHNGVLIVTSLKDFGRKLQNLSKIGYTLFLVILLPVMISIVGLSNQINDPLFLPAMIIIMTGLMLGVMGANTFGGVGFLESKDHLWILKSNPKGVTKYIKSRLASFFFIGVLYAVVPGFIVGLIVGLSLSEIGVLILFSFLSVCGTIMISIGVTAFNPSYEDSKSSAFVINTIASMMISMVSIMIGVIYAILSIILERMFVIPVLIGAIPVLVAGLVTLGIGTLCLMKSEDA